MKEENKNLILAIVCTLLVFFAMDHFFPRNKQDSEQKIETSVSVESDMNVGKGEKLPMVVESKIDDSTLKIKSETLSGQIRLRGALINQLTFLKYKETIKKDSPDVTFLTLSYFAYMGVLGKDIDLPNENTLWKASADVLTPTQPVVLSWTNSQGITFKRTISLDDQYMFTITNSVENNAGKPIFIAFEGGLNRFNPSAEAVTSVHQGFVGVLDGKLHEEKYSSISFSSSNGLPLLIARS